MVGQCINCIFKDLSSQTFLLVCWPLKMGQVGCPKVSVNMLCNIPEDWRPQLYCGRCLKSSNYKDIIFSDIFTSHFTSVVFATDQFISLLPCCLLESQKVMCSYLEGFLWCAEFIQEVFYVFGQKFQVHMFQRGEQLTNMCKTLKQCLVSYLVRITLMHI